MMEMGMRTVGFAHTEACAQQGHSEQCAPLHRRPPATQATYREQWGVDPDLLAAAGYDTARLLALVAAAPLPKTDDGRLDHLGWIP